MKEKNNGVLLDFYSKGCAPCKRMESVINEFSEANDVVEVKKIEASESPEVFDSYGIAKVPTFVYMKDGKEKGRLSGVCSKKEIERLVSEG
ncbi:MAG: thioredoxin family protein [Clostridia bacterium]|nr:thioredoxin family protein [Clostridia bacterium]